RISRTRRYAARWPGSARRSNEREKTPWKLALHCHISLVRVPNGLTFYEPMGFPLRITRREFVVSTGALIAAGALFGSTSLALADPTPEELMRPGPLPDMVLGKADAPVTIVEYASMTCPHCANFDKTTFPALKSKYIDAGKVRFVFR